MKKLTIIDTFGNINAFSLDDSGTSRYYLGRTDIRSSGEKNDIVIPSPTISREHGKFKVEDGRVLYADLNSLNGTICESDGQQQYLHGNSKYIQLQPGDMLRVQPRESRADNSVLIIYTDSTETGSWRKFSLMTPTVKIGSDMNNDIVLPVGSASPLHAVIEKSGTGYRITSGRGEGRIFLNGKKIQNGADLHEKDVVRIGDSTLIFSNDAIFCVSELEGIRIEARNLSLTVGKAVRQPDSIALKLVMIWRIINLHFIFRIIKRNLIYNMLIQGIAVQINDAHYFTPFQKRFLCN